jgi:ribosomal protein S18 acetylase RimI-like enzyme
MAVMEHPLDNPIWHALTGPHRKFAIGHGRARHYPRDMAPFSGIAEETPEAYADLAIDLQPQTEARLFRPTEHPAPRGWQTVSAKPIVQMIYARLNAPQPNDLDARIALLGPTDVPDMLGLIDVAKPGPFAPRTIQLGSYVGVRHVRTGQLIAMGGERLRVEGHVEVSAIAVHPDARGAGLGRAITNHLTRSATSSGETPFLHVYPDNPAMGLYTRLGFRERARLWVLWHRPVLEDCR